MALLAQAAHDQAAEDSAAGALVTRCSGRANTFPACISSVIVLAQRSHSQKYCK
jgi:hypothetical protein